MPSSLQFVEATGTPCSAATDRLSARRSVLACGGPAANLQIFVSSVCAGSFFAATPDSSTLHLECRCADAAHANYLCVSWVCVVCFSCLPALIPQRAAAVALRSLTAALISCYRLVVQDAASRCSGQRLQHPRQPRRRAARKNDEKIDHSQIRYTVQVS